MVEGQALRRLGEYPSYDGIRIFQDRDSRDTERRNSRSLEPVVARHILVRPISYRMRLPIHLDRQTLRLLAQCLPQDDFPQRHASA
jgi:hypothetical protein